MVEPLKLSREELENLANRVRYIGSAEHKTYPSPAGHPALRSSASKCPPQINIDQAEQWLRSAIRLGQFSTLFEGAFPRHVWGKFNDRYWEARLSNRSQGLYHGYEVDPDVDDIPADVLRRL